MCKKIENILNFTPHLVTYIYNYKKYNFKPVGVIRLIESEAILLEQDNIVMIDKDFNNVFVDIKKEINPTDYYIIVSLPVLLGVKFNPIIKKKLKNKLKGFGINVIKFIAPNTCEDSVIRDNDGIVVGIKNFIC